MSTIISIFGAIISLMAFCVSFSTFWFTHIKRGKLKMTNPPIIYFGYDRSSTEQAKIFIRTLLFSTASKGLILESMYAKIICNGDESVFGFWGHGEFGKLTFGGLFIGQDGCAADHHFLHTGAKSYDFQHGNYIVQLYARLVGRRRPTPLQKICLFLNEDLLFHISNEGVIFEFNPRSQHYCARAK